MYVDAVPALSGEAVSMSAIDTGDHIVHKRTRDLHVVACVHGDAVYTCGYPSRTLLLSDCELWRKASEEDQLALLRQMAAVQSLQHRPRCARARLAAIEAAATSYDSGCC